MVSHRHNVIVRIVIGHDGVTVICQSPVIDNEGITAILGCEDSRGFTRTDDLVRGLVFSTDSVTIEENGVLITEFHPRNVDSITRDGDSVPPGTHGAVRRAPRLLQSHRLLLLAGWGYCGLLVDSSDSLSGYNRVFQDLIVGFVTVLARQVVELPLTAEK